jgi:hypothetical protein
MTRIKDMLAGVGGSIVMAIVVGIVGFYAIKYLMKLLEKVKGNVENGARGLGNKVEEFLVNLLPAVLIEHEIAAGDSIHVEDLQGQELIVTVQHKISESTGNQ